MLQTLNKHQDLQILLQRITLNQMLKLYQPHHTVIPLSQAIQALKNKMPELHNLDQHKLDLMEQHLAITIVHTEEEEYQLVHTELQLTTAPHLNQELLHQEVLLTEICKPAHQPLDQLLLKDHLKEVLQSLDLQEQAPQDQADQLQQALKVVQDQPVQASQDQLAQSPQAQQPPVQDQPPPQLKLDLFQPPPPALQDQLSPLAQALQGQSKPAVQAQLDTQAPPPPSEPPAQLLQSDQQAPPSQDHPAQPP
jgi:hypothetical protein